MVRLPFRLGRNRVRITADAAATVPRIEVREVEERIATIDELGMPRTLICIRTWARIQRADGVVDIEQARRYTLPGFGHVYRIGHGEYVVFRDRTRLYARSQTTTSASEPATRGRPARTERDVGHLASLPGSTAAPQSRGGARRWTFAVVGGLVLAPLTFALWTLIPRDAPSSASSGAFLPAARYAEEASTSNESNFAALPATLSDEAQPMPSPKPVAVPVRKDVAAHASASRVVFAIRPWGVVYVNGKKRGTSPPVKELKLKPGRYAVEIRNGPYQPYRRTLHLRGQATASVVHDFFAAEAASSKASAPSLASVSRSHTRFLSEEWPR